MASAKISMVEQETIITFNRAERQAEIYTFEPRLKRCLEELSETCPDIRLVLSDDGSGSVCYMLPKECVSIIKPKDKTQQESK